MKLPEFEIDDALKIVGDYADVLWGTEDAKNCACRTDCPCCHTAPTDGLPVPPTG